ncbi:hypothetical protein FKP32DRAFT_611939 [Trametes sanguinea]|nr:hypothetical protein FKP32DRAFT_611939 [Trametes sanguinea]
MVACLRLHPRAHYSPSRAHTRCSLRASNPRFSNSKTPGMHERTLFVPAAPSLPYPNPTLHHSHALAGVQLRQNGPPSRRRPSQRFPAADSEHSEHSEHSDGRRITAARDSGSNSFWAVSSFELRGLGTRRNANLPAPRVPSALNVETIVIGGPPPSQAPGIS